MRRYRLRKRIIAIILALALLPLDSFEGCFVVRTQAAERQTESRSSEGTESKETGEETESEESGETGEEAESEESGETGEEAESEESGEETGSGETGEETESEETGEEAESEESGETDETGAQEVEELQFCAEMDACGTVQLSWNDWQREEISPLQYEIHRNQELLEIEMVREENRYVCSDSQTEAGQSYSYLLVVKDEQGNVLLESDQSEIHTPEALTVTSDFRLEEDIQVFSLELAGGTFDLNGHTITI